MAFQACGKMNIFFSINAYYFPACCQDAGLACRNMSFVDNDNFELGCSNGIELLWVCKSYVKECSCVVG